MSDPPPSVDPRTLWRWIRWIGRTIPGWLLLSLTSLGRFTLFVTRKKWQSDLPVYAGIRLWIGGANADLYHVRIREALDLLERYAPVHLRWLRSTFQVIMVDQLLRIMRRGLRADYWVRILALNPWTVWNTSADRLALFLVAQATRGRLRRSLRSTDARRNQDSPRIYLETIECARRFPNSTELVAEWEDRLRRFIDDDRGAAA